MTNDTTPDETSGDSDAPAAPVLRVTSGTATAEEIAALTVLFAAVGGEGGGGEPNLRRGWSRPARRLGGGFAGATGWGR